MDFEAMSLDELVAYRVERKAKIAALREEIIATNEIYQKKVDEQDKTTRALATGTEPVQVMN